MKELLGIFPLENCQTNEFEDAELYTPIDEKNLKDFETLWQPMFKAKLEKDNNVAPDGHWEWRKKAIAREGRIDYESYAVECNGDTQGLMFVRSTDFAKELSQLNQFLIYVDLISSAPWNRPGFTDNRIYKGVGPLLISTAISYSIDQGFKGRIGLHSLPESESWYRDECGMTDLGIDRSYQNLRYFEMTVVQAQTYITT